jgi:hypothetical protein
MNVRMSEVSTEIHGMNVNDYFCCLDCQEFVDWWKFKDLEDTGHEGHKVRNVTLEELRECVADCEEEIEYCTDCLEYLDQEGAKERHNGHNIVVESCLTKNFLFGPFKHEPLSSRDRQSR